MLISASDWERYVNRLAAIDESVARQMRAYIEVNGYDHPDDIINIAYQLSTKYGEAAAEATCEMYDAIAAAQGVNVPAAEPARTPSLEETRNMIERVLNITRPEEYSKTVPAETSKLVKKTSTRTMRKNAARDGAKMALIPSGDGCAFCKMLGSRGWEDARSSKSFEAHLHAHCRCEYCVRFNNNLSVDGYDPDELLEEYNSTGGKNSKEKLNLMRKAYREEHKDEINAQKRENYALKQSGGKTTGGHHYRLDENASPRDIAAAKKYEEYSRVDDSELISKNTGFSKEEIQEIKRHVFYEKHDLYEGFARFDPDYDMAVAWKRLREGRALPRDITLLNHELLESRLMKEYNLDAAEAHRRASQTYDWAKQLFDEMGEKGEPDGLL